MSTTVKINFPTIPIAVRNQVIGGVCNAFIRWVPGLEPGPRFSYWGLALNDVDIYPNIRLHRIIGEFRQLDANWNVLTITEFDVLRGNAIVIEGYAYPGAIADRCEVYIKTIEMFYALDVSLNIDQILDGLENDIIEIRTIDADGNISAKCSVQPNKVITTAKLREIVTVKGQPPIRIFNITTQNTNPYIKEWWAEIKSVTGTPNPDDRLVLELLDANDNVLASNNVGIGVGNKIAVQHQSNGAKIRVTLNTNVFGLSVDVEISEAIDITYGT